MERWANEPCLGGTPLIHADTGIPSAALAVPTAAIGYVQNVDIPALSRLCERLDAEMFISALPGTFLYGDSPLASILCQRDKLNEEVRGDIRAAFSIDHERSFDQDPRFGLAVMSEIACRALSAAVNDPGTAIDVVGRSTRLLSIWSRTARPLGQIEPKHPRLHVPPLEIGDLFEDAFATVAETGQATLRFSCAFRKRCWPCPERETTVSGPQRGTSPGLHLRGRSRLWFWLRTCNACTQKSGQSAGVSRFSVVATRRSGRAPLQPARVASA